MAKLGDYLFGNVLTSVIAGATTFVWCILFDVPYAVLLGVIVAIVDLFPYASTVGGFIVAAVALAVSIPVSVATVVFYIAFRLGEDYLLTPKIIRVREGTRGCHRRRPSFGRGVAGVVGALVAVPIARLCSCSSRNCLSRRSMKLDRTVMELTTSDWTAAH